MGLAGEGSRVMFETADPEVFARYVKN